ncbi:MAG: DUF3892 domain-containing protein [Archangium sp.]|nr:DUF3892 domain-containing protein [Archangium sp.]
MADVQITCITKIPRDNTHEGITHLGNAQGKWARAQVIEWIEGRVNTFFTVSHNVRADIAVVNGPNGKYLRTHANGQYTDNLLSLPECP